MAPQELKLTLFQSVNCGTDSKETNDTTRHWNKPTTKPGDAALYWRLAGTAQQGRGGGVEASPVHFLLKLRVPLHLLLQPRVHRPLLLRHLPHLLLLHLHLHTITVTRQWRSRRRRGEEEEEGEDGGAEAGFTWRSRPPHLSVELSSLLLQLGQSQSQLGAALQLLLPEGLGVLGRVGQQALLLDLEQEQQQQGNQRSQKNPGQLTPASLSSIQSAVSLF